MDIEAEINELKRRVGDLEGAVRVLAAKVQAADPMLAALRETTSRRFDTSEQLMTGIVKRLDTVSAQVWSLRDDLPALLDAAFGRRGRGPSERM